MRQALLPAALLCAALGLALSHAAKPARPAALAAAIAILTALIPLSGLSPDLAFTGGWLTILITAAGIHLPPAWRHKAVLYALAALTGLFAGLVTHIQGGALTLLPALPLLLLFIPGAWLIRRNWGIGLKIVCSWLIAIALLEIGLNFVPTPGYMPDHMD